MNPVTARVAVPSACLSFGAALHHDQTPRIELVQFVPAGGVLTPYFWAETRRPAEFEATLREADCIDTITRLHDGGERHLYHVEWALDSDPFLQTLREQNLAVERAVSVESDWHFVVLCSSHDHFQAFQRSLRERDIPSTVLGVWTTQVPLTKAQGLTSKQRQALELAFLEGYFDIPPRTNLTELAAQVDISRQSYTRRLSRGLHRVLEHTLMAEP